MGDGDWYIYRYIKKEQRQKNLKTSGTHVGVTKQGLDMSAVNRTFLPEANTSSASCTAIGIFIRSSKIGG
jgi:hypothetical protein